MQDPATTSGSEATKPDGREPIEIARDMLARALESEFPGVQISHGPYGWTASRDGVEICRAQSGPGLRALIPFMDKGPSTAGPEDAA
jgi:hypothetical protein